MKQSKKPRFRSQTFPAFLFLLLSGANGIDSFANIVRTKCGVIERNTHVGIIHLKIRTVQSNSALLFKKAEILPLYCTVQKLTTLQHFSARTCCCMLHQSFRNLNTFKLAEFSIVGTYL